MSMRFHASLPSKCKPSEPCCTHDVHCLSTQSISPPRNILPTVDCPRGQSRQPHPVWLEPEKQTGLSAKTSSCHLILSPGIRWTQHHLERSLREQTGHTARLCDPSHPDSPAIPFPSSSSFFRNYRLCSCHPTIAQVCSGSPTLAMLQMRNGSMEKYGSLSKFGGLISDGGVEPSQTYWLYSNTGMGLPVRQKMKGPKPRLSPH